MASIFPERINIGYQGNSKTRSSKIGKILSINFKSEHISARKRKKCKHAQSMKTLLNLMEFLWN